jgi:hypothetical protein
VGYGGVERRRSEIRQSWLATSLSKHSILSGRSLCFRMVRSI